MNRHKRTASRLQDELCIDMISRSLCLSLFKGIPCSVRTNRLSVVPVPPCKHSVVLVLDRQARHSMQGTAKASDTHLLEAVYGETVRLHDGLHLRCQCTDELSSIVLEGGIDHRQN